VVVAQRRIGSVSLLGLSTVNLGSHAFYRYGGRGLLSTDLMVTPLIKALRRV
jgi:hypothetical protein